jgi:hypothetical protein
VPTDKRQEFARRAEWFRYLAERDKGSLAFGVSQDPSLDRSKARSRSLLTTLWLVGGALYLISTLLFTNAIGLFGDHDVSTSVGEVNLPISRPPLAVSVENSKKAQDLDHQVSPAAERPHAVSPDQPSYEAPGLMVPATGIPEEEIAGPASSEPIEQASISPANTSEPEIFKVTRVATIRSGPSATAKVIGTASLGAELQVKERANGWIRFVDPSSGNSGWIQSDVVAGISHQAKQVAPSDSEQAPGLNPQKPKLVQKAGKQKPKGPSKAARSHPSKQPSPDPRGAYADLPDDGDFIDAGPGWMGPFARRRMLREGLMSPDFIPPR